MPKVKPKSTEKELQSELESKQQQIKELMDSSAALKASIDALTKKINDIKQLSNPYKQLLQNIETEKKDIAGTAIQKTAVVNNALDEETKQDISAKIKEIDDTIEVLKSEEDTLIKNVEDINKEITEAKGDIEKKKTDYDLLKNYQKTVEEDLKDLKDLKTSLQKEDNPKILFYYLEALTKINEKTYDSSEELVSKLNTAWDELEEAKAKLSGKEAELKTEQAKLDAKTKEKDMKIKNRKDDIINKIK